MTKIKIITIVYFLLLISGGAILFNIGMNMHSVLENYSPANQINSEYTMLQTRAGIYSIIIFIVLLLVSFILYYYTEKRNYIFLSNILYIGAILYVYVTVNKNYYLAQNLEYSQQGEYWITIFMGIFYIVGAVLVSAIGYITIRNYTKRNQNKSHKSIRKRH